MSEAKSVSDSWHSTLSGDLGLRDRETEAVTDAWPTEDELLDAYMADDDFTDASGVGQQTSDRLYRYIDNVHPEKVREKIESSEKYCTDFTTDHGLDGDSNVFQFAFVCPSDGTVNPLRGDPADFKNRPFRCEGCGWVPLLDGKALAEFREKHYDSEAGEVNDA